jgi:hypothetical protein
MATRAKPPKKAKKKVPIYDCMQFDVLGSEVDIIEWMNTLVPAPGFTYQLNGNVLFIVEWGWYLNLGDWVTTDDNGELYAISQADFDKKFTTQ